jgi:hypothetical protein
VQRHAFDGAVADDELSGINGKRTKQNKTIMHQP